MPQSRVLSSEEVRTLRAELDGGGTPTVWFTASAVGVPEGRSGKVIGLDDAEEGDFIQVRPAGSKDVLSFSAAEVTLEKPPRKRTQPTPAKTGTASAKASEPAKRSAGVEPTATASTSTRAGQSRTGASQQTEASAGSGTSAASGASKGSGTSKGSGSPRPASSSGSRGTGRRATQKDDPAEKAGSAERASAPAKATRRKPKQPGEATVTLTADESGQWSVEVTTGKKRVLKPTSVSASAVAQAAKALHDDVADAVEPVVEAARDKQRERVEQLRQELTEAQRKLDDLG